VVAVKDYPSMSLKFIRPIVAGHPAPDANSSVAAEEIIRLATRLEKDDLLIFLLSGGASSLAADLPSFCSLQEMKAFYTDLVNCGASIHEVNAVRKHISELKGGRLAKMCKGHIVSFIISDVAGNDLSVIGSGPTAPDLSTYNDAMDVLVKYNLIQRTPPAVLQLLRKGTNGEIAETPKLNDSALERCRNYIVADIHKAMRAAAQTAEGLGYHVEMLHNLMTGNTEHEARTFMQRALQQTHQSPHCVIAGGETVIHVNREGAGGRNQHFALAALNECNVNDGWALLAAGTDGIDGNTNAAGAFADAQCMLRAGELSLDAQAFLSSFNSFDYFRQTNSLFMPGATGTNVMDLVVLLC
jgi:glycerate-2-kinase